MLPISLEYYSRPKRNRRQSFCNFFFLRGGGGGGGVYKVHYGLCENSKFAQSVNIPVFPCKW